MKAMHKAWLAVLVLLLIAASAGWWLTEPPSANAVKKRAAVVTSAALVDESTYTSALRLAQLAKTPEEQPYALTALRVADHELALAFTAALRDVEAHPPDLSPKARAIQDRLAKSQALLDSDQQRVTQLSAALAAANESQKDTLHDELELAQSQLDLDKDEVEEANQDLVAAGGNPQQRIEAMVQEHDAQVKARAAAAPAGPIGPAETERLPQGVPRVAGIAARAATARRRRRSRPATGGNLERAANGACCEPGGNQGRNRRTRTPHEERQGCRKSGQSRAALGTQP